MRFRRAGGRASLGLVAPIVALALTASAAAAVPTAHVTQVGAAPAGQPIDLVFPLVADESGLGRFATSVSTPGSIHYGQFESIAALSARYGATAATKRKVVAYLHRVGASAIKIDSTGLFAYATVPAGLAQRLFGTPLAQFRTARGARFVAPTSAARVPSGLRGAVTDVIGLNTIPLSNSTGALRASGSSRFRAHAASRPTSALPRTGTVSSSACAAGASAGEIGGDPTTAGFTPNQYLTAYGFDPLHNAGFRGQGERVALIEIDGFSDSDIRAFARCFHLDIPALNGFGVGVKHPLPPGGESTLDLEVLDAAAPDLKAIDVYESKPTAADTLRSLTAPLQNRGFKPQVVSASLGSVRGRAARLDRRRRASGRRSRRCRWRPRPGSRSSPPAAIRARLTAPRRAASRSRGLAVNYPASSWWVTGVGGTNFALNAANQITGQLVWNDTFVQAGLGRRRRRERAVQSALLPERDGRPEPPGGSRCLDARGHHSGLRDLLHGERRLQPLAPMDDGRRHERGDPAARRWIRADRSGAADAQAPGPRPGQPAALQDRPLLARRRGVLRRPQLRQRHRPRRWQHRPFARLLSRQRTGSTRRRAGGASTSRASRRWRSRTSRRARASRSPPISIRSGATRSWSRSRVRWPAARVRSRSSPSVRRSRSRSTRSAFTLPAGGKKTLSLRFNSGQQRKLRSGVSHNRRIEAEVAGVILDSHNHVQAQTPGKFLTIRR